MTTENSEIQTIQHQCNFKVLCKKIAAAEGPLSNLQLQTNTSATIKKTETYSIEPIPIN